MLGVGIGGGVGLGCDQVSPSQTGGAAPRVTNLRVVPDTVRAPASADSTSANLGISFAIEDPDRNVERGLLTLEPASAPGRARAIQLSAVQLQIGRVSFGLRLPVERDVYTVRMFAVDQDSLTSNQGVTQFQMVPDP